MRPFIFFTTIVFLCTGPLILAQDRKPDDFFPVSVWYSGGKARAPMLSTMTPESREEWGRDVDQIKSLGFNTVRTWVEWAHCEPRKGEFHFENLKLLFELAKERDLRVIVQIYADSAPDWVGREFPDSLLEAQSGEKVQSQAAPGFCTDHPGVRAAVLKFYEETAKVATQYPNLFAWDLWSEPHILNWAEINYVPNAQFCFCPHTRARFREWLKAKYGDVPALNKAWYRNFEKWDEVDPPRFGTILSYTDFIDWKVFIYDKMAGDLRMRYEAIRKVDSVHTITSHAAAPSIFGSPFNGDGACDDFLMAKQLDYYGTSIYPKHSNPKTHWPTWQIAVAMDFERCANMPNGGFYIGELQAGPGARGVVLGDPITPEDHRIWLWSAISRGAKAVNFYAYYTMSSGYESNGYGLIGLDGKPTERAIATGAQAQIVNKNANVLLNSKSIPAKIAIVYNPLSQMVGGEQNSGPPNALRDSLIGYWRALWEDSIPSDFIHREQLESGDLSQYLLIIVPYPIMWTQKAADGLKKYVEQGGAVVAEARLAWNNERGYAATEIPGMGLAEVFGVQEDSVQMVDTVNMSIDLTMPVPGCLPLAPAEVKGAYLNEIFTRRGATSASASAEETSSNWVESHYGKGKTLILGSFLGMATQQTQDVKNREFIRQLASWVGPGWPIHAYDIEPSSEPLEVRLRNTSDGAVIFAINHAHKDRHAHIVFGIEPDGEYILTNLMDGSESRTVVNEHGISMLINIAERGVQVWHVHKAK